MIWKLRTYFPALLLLALFSGFIITSGNANATTISSNIYSTAIYSKNFNPDKIRYNSGPTTSPLYAFSETNVTGLWDYTQALSFSNPFSNKTGTGFASSIYFTMHSVTGNFLNMNLKTLMAKSNLGFEGIDENKPYCTQSWKATFLDTSTVQFLLESSCPAGSFPDNTNFNQVEASIDFSPDSMFWCANDNSQHQCPGHLGVTVYNIDYYFKVLTTQSESYNQTIISQNQTIINQNQQMYDFLSDSTPPSADTSVLAGSAGWLPPGPVDSILNLPIQLVQGIVGVFTNTNTCAPIQVPLGIIDYTLEIPCMRPFFEMAGVNIVWNTVGSIISAFLVYNTLKWLYKFVDDTLTFRENESTMWGGL